MAFSDWDQETRNNVNITPNTTVPLEGLQSLEIEKFTGGTVTAGGSVVPSDASGLTKGLTAGRMRTQMQLLSGLASTGGNAGIFFMVADLTEDPFALDDLYSVHVHGLGGIRIGKHSNGLISSPTNLAVTSNGEIADVTSPFTLEVMWFYDIPEFNGVRIIVKKGLATDYSDLTVVSGLDIIDATSPLSVSNAEGLAYFTTSGVNNVWLFDRTEFYSVDFV